MRQGDILNGVEFDGTGITKNVSEAVAESLSGFRVAKGNIQYFRIQDFLIFNY